MNGGLPGTFTIGASEDTKKRHLVPYRCDLCGVEDQIDSRIFKGPRALETELLRRCRSHKCRKPTRIAKAPQAPPDESRQPLREFEAGDNREIARNRKR